MFVALVLAALLSQSFATGAKIKPPGLKTRATTFAPALEDCCSPPLLPRATAKGQRRGFSLVQINYLPFASNAFAAQDAGAKQKKSNHATASTEPRVSLAPRFSSGQAFRYSMEFETTTSTSRSGLAADPEGPSKLVITWNATILLQVLPAEANAQGNIRLRTTYESSTAHVTSDTFDPAAAATEEQYKKLQGKVVEFTLDANGKVILVAGLEDIVNGEKAAQAAREWISQLGAGSGAPLGGVTVGQKWTSDQPASLPVAGLVWRTDSEYMRNEICHPPNLEAPPAPSSTESGANPDSAETCAVILTHLNLLRPKSVRNPTPEDYRKNGMQTAGRWDGAAQSLSYISLRTGLAVSVTQTGSEEMDVTLTTGKSTSMHYKGTVLSRSQVALVSAESRER
ncbi:MAG: hypothetical protein JWN92_1969 [Candidatus Acidoferrum typicum]|nr:hypothetical protein [Candidatus Acidoferrum typicum]